MITEEDLQEMLAVHFPGDEIVVQDMTGTSDHFDVRVVSARFEGLSLIEQHKLIHAACKEHMGGAIHALKIKTLTP
jgi:stress-induced morphogen